VESSLVTEHLRRIAGVEHEISVTQPASERRARGLAFAVRSTTADFRCAPRGRTIWSPSTPVG